MEKQLYQRPDRFQLVGGLETNNGSKAELKFENNVHGDWHLSDDLLFSYMSKLAETE